MVQYLVREIKEIAFKYQIKHFLVHQLDLIPIKI